MSPPSVSAPRGAATVARRKTPGGPAVPRGTSRPLRSERPQDARGPWTSHREAWRGRPREQSGDPDGEGERPGGGNPRKASARASARARGRTSSPRERSPEADRVRPLPMGARRIDAGNDRRAGAPRGVPIGARRTPWREKPMDAPTPSGAGRVGGGRREGGRETPHAARGWEPELLPTDSGSAVPSRVVGHESPGEEASSDQPVRPAGRCGGAATDL
jgi:hypothetical protein